MADKAYDANAIRRFIESRNAARNIPFKASRRWKGCFSPFLYRAGKTSVTLILTKQ